MKTIYKFLVLFLASTVISFAADDVKFNPALSVIPPSPVTDNIVLDLRGRLCNPTQAPLSIQWSFQLASSSGDVQFEQSGKAEVAPQSVQGVKVQIPTKGFSGKYDAVFSTKSDAGNASLTEPVEIIDSDVRSTRKIDGAWFGIYHWSEAEGKRWNSEIKKVTDDQWKEMVVGMNQIGMNIIVLQELFRHQVYYNRHDIAANGYYGKAFYPSKLYPGRMDIAAKDPVEAILSQADELGMKVFMGVGLYAWFDYSADSLQWHKEVASEIWEMYGHHPSFYGWYLSEIAGSMVPHHLITEDKYPEFRKDFITFFKEYREYVHAFAPEKPIMMAPNCYFMASAENEWRRALQYIDIICPFGFHRMPEGDVSGETVAAWLQKICNEEKAHLWMDMEVFL
ncbi:DUF4434 domain-containing protein, partial [bacterium]|nr:DUF4434 domain-containing protein [bacterium]